MSKEMFEKNLESQMFTIHENMNHVKISLSKSKQCSSNLCDQIEIVEANICRSVQELRINILLVLNILCFIISIENFMFSYLNLIKI